MNAFLATVHILVRASSDSEAADVVSAVLTEGGIYEPDSGVIDWSYRFVRDRYRHPAAVVVPDDYDRDEFPLHSLAQGDCS
jgi:hypothetical protein